ncbi:MAG: Gx transporter family protein [Eubacteriales bacterium]
MLKNKIAYMGLITALALVFSYAESLVPLYFAVPGIKLGLANVVIVMALYQMGFRDALIISTTRVILAGFFFGNLMSILFSLAGCTLSLVVMNLLYKRESFSVMGVSIAGAVFHNIGQIIVAIIIVESFGVIYYFALLLIAALVTGLIIGILASEMIKRIKIMGDVR